MGSSKKFVVLNLGKKRSFQSLREKLLSGAGYEVVSCKNPKEVADALATKPVQALVVGAWVPKDERDEAVHSVKAKNPHAAIVFYYDQNIDGTELADAILNLRGDHADLVRTLGHLFAKVGSQTMQKMAAMIFSAGVLPLSWMAATL